MNTAAEDLLTRPETTVWVSPYRPRPLATTPSTALRPDSPRRDRQEGGLVPPATTGLDLTPAGTTA